jgi:predicted acyl esterase
MFLLDGSDGIATMEWIALQSWHSGGIVTNGMSALGIVQFAVAVLRSPHHAGMWIDWASPSGKSATRFTIHAVSVCPHECAVFSQLSFPQGCFRQHDVTGWLNATARDAPDIMQVLPFALAASVRCAALISLRSY